MNGFQEFLRQTASARDVKGGGLGESANTLQQAELLGRALATMDEQTTKARAGTVPEPSQETRALFPSPEYNTITPAASPPEPQLQQQPALPIVSNAAQTDPLSPIEDILALSPAQAILVKQQCLTELVSGESSSSRLSAAKILIELSALSKRDRIRHASTQPQQTIFNVVQVMNQAKSLSAQYDEPSINEPR